MMTLSNKRLYKVTSLLIKTVILIFSFLYIWEKITGATDTINFENLIGHSNKILLFFVFLLMLVNWGVEALKWKLLINSAEPISYRKSIKSIFAGVTVSIFTPSRVGEFVGRIFFLDKSDKIQAALKSFVGSILQLFITITTGVAAYFILDIYYNNYFQVKPFISSKGVATFIFCFAFFLASVLFVYSKRNKQFISYKKYIDAFTDYSIAELSVITALSLFRYFVFSFQYYLIMKFFGIQADITILFSLIALTFFVTSVIPTFSLTEIAVRGATAVYFFSMAGIDSTAIIASSLLLWMINLAIPALIGSVFIINLKLIKD